MAAPRGKQLKINDNVVNASANLVDTVNLIPLTHHFKGKVEISLNSNTTYPYTFFECLFFRSW